MNDMKETIVMCATAVAVVGILMIGLIVMTSILTDSGNEKNQKVQTCLDAGRTWVQVEPGRWGCAAKAER